VRVRRVCGKVCVGRAVAGSGNAEHGGALGGSCREGRGQPPNKTHTRRHRRAHLLQVVSNLLQRCLQLPPIDLLACQAEPQWVPWPGEV
jgi:hypothetical protein